MTPETKPTNQQKKWVLRLYELVDENTGETSESGLAFRHGETFSMSAVTQSIDIRTDTFKSRIFFEDGDDPHFILFNNTQNLDTVLKVNNQIVPSLHMANTPDDARAAIYDGAIVQIGLVKYKATLAYDRPRFNTDLGETPPQPAPQNVPPSLATMERQRFNEYIASDVTVKDMQIKTVSAIDRGLNNKRHQEDAIGYFSRMDQQGDLECLWLVADGLGGHSNGDDASEFAVRFVLHYYFEHGNKKPEDRLREAFELVHKDLVQYGKDLTKIQHTDTIVATTLTTLALHKNSWYLVHLGDSPGLFFEGVKDPNHVFLQEITKNHNDPDNRSVLKYSLGDPTMTHYKPGTWVQRVLPGDRWVLCTDGLYPTMIKASEIQSGLAQIRDTTTLTSTWVDKVLDGGAKDNFSCIVVSADLSAETKPVFQEIVYTKDDAQRIFRSTTPFQLPSLRELDTHPENSSETKRKLWNFWKGRKD